MVSLLPVCLTLSNPAKAQVPVDGYYRDDGTYVKPHYRSEPDGDFYNNWSTDGNINPYTGEEGDKTAPPEDYDSGMYELESPYQDDPIESEEAFESDEPSHYSVPDRAIVKPPRIAPYESRPYSSTSDAFIGRGAERESGKEGDGFKVFAVLVLCVTVAIAAIPVRGLELSDKISGLMLFFGGTLGAIAGAYGGWLYAITGAIVGGSSAASSEFLIRLLHDKVLRVMVAVLLFSLLSVIGIEYAFWLGQASGPATENEFVIAVMKFLAHWLCLIFSVWGGFVEATNIDPYKL